MVHASQPAFPTVSCDFELDMCGWSSPADERLHGFAWGWKSGVPLAKYPGPEQDHTLGTKDGRRHPSPPPPHPRVPWHGWEGQEELGMEEVTHECPLHFIPALKSLPLSALSLPQAWTGTRPGRTDPMRGRCPPR